MSLLQGRPTEARDLNPESMLVMLSGLFETSTFVFIRWTREDSSSVWRKYTYVCVRIFFIYVNTGVYEV